MQTKISPTGIQLIKQFESLSLEAYRCPAGVWTIGYGHTAGVRRGDRIDEEQAGELLAGDLRKFEAVVNRQCSEGLNQSQFDALVSFVFNVGETAFLRSTLLKRVKEDPRQPAIRTEFGRWTYAGGKELAGLIRRREAEADLYFGGE